MSPAPPRRVPVDDPSGGIRLAGVIDEDPFDIRTWSGSSAHFFEALRGIGVLRGAVAARPAAPVRLLYRLANFTPGRRAWRFRYNTDVRYYRRMTAAGHRALGTLGHDTFDVVLQVGAWYDMTGRGKPVVSYHDGNLACLLASPFGHPSIDPAHLRRALAYERDLYRRIDLIFPMSEWLASSFVHDNGVERSKVLPVGAGINLPRVRQVTRTADAPPSILFVGRDFERKGGPGLLEAFARVRRFVPQAELTVVGPTLADPPAGVRCVGPLSKAVPEELERLLDEYVRATVFVLPSLYEPFGIALIEAMAHRLPCIGTDICAMPEIIEAGSTGFLVPPGDSAALADKLAQLLTDPRGAIEMGEAGFHRYQRHYTWDAVARRILGATKSLLP